MRARLAVNGSLEYDLTWKHWDTESDAPICALRASARRISVNVSTGWPIEGWPKTPQASDGDGGVMEIRPETTGKYKLRDFAQLAGFPTTKASDFKQNRTMEGAANERARKGTSSPDLVTTTTMLSGWTTAQCHDTNPRGAGNRENPNGGGACLGWDAKLSGWATAAATTWGGSAEAHLERKRKAIAAGVKMGLVVSCLDQQATLAGWPTTTTRDSKGTDAPNRAGAPSLCEIARGVIFAWCLVPMGRRVVLAPEFSLWLMGFPEAWARAAPGSESWRVAQAALESGCSKDLETQSSPS